MSVRQHEARPAESSSRTMTITPTPAEPQTGASIPDDERRETVGTLRLRGGPVRRQKVMWSENTIDNEGMGKKKSKICCIYHRPKAFDESSSESSSGSEDEGEHKSKQPQKHQSKQRRRKDTGGGNEIETSSESDGGAGDGGARPSRAKGRTHRHAHNCQDHHHDGHTHRDGANKYDKQSVPKPNPRT